MSNEKKSLKEAAKNSDCDCGKHYEVDSLAKKQSDFIGIAFRTVPLTDQEVLGYSRE